jgi:acetyltransferase-like isoleucine patch superfamily enzyme
MAVAVVLAVTTLLTPTNAYTQIPANDELPPVQLETMSRILDQLRQEILVIESVEMCPNEFEFRTQRIRREIRRFADELTRLSGLFDRHAAGTMPGHAVRAEIENGVDRLAEEIASLHAVTDQLALDCSPQWSTSDHLAALASDGSISGTVTDSATSLPIEGERVIIYDASGNYLGADYTDSDGAYAITMGLPAGTYFARTYSDSGYLDELYNDIACSGWCDVTTGTPIVVGAGEDVTGIDFVLDKGGSISGTVTDSATSLGIGSIDVSIYDANGNYLTYGYTDSNGAYTTLRALPAGTYFARTFSYSGYLDEVYDGIACSGWCDVTGGTPITVGAVEDVTGVDFVLDKGGSISGTVTDAATAAAIALGYIYIYDESGDYAADGYTDSNGDYTTYQGLPAGNYFAVTDNYSGYLNELYDNIPCASGCDVTSGTPITVGAGEDVTGIDFALDKGGSISGTVTDSATAAGLEDLEIDIFNASGDYVAYGYSDSNGNYTTYQGLPAGTYYAIAYSYSGYLNELYDNIPCASGCDVTSGTPITVGAGEDVTGIDFALDKGGTIAGAVTDAATSLGIGSTSVQIYNESGNYVGYGYTDSNGFYKTRQGLPAGTYFARTYNSSGYLNELYSNMPCASSCDVTTGTPITVGAGEDVTGIDFALDKGGTISGTVIDSATSLPIEGERVRIYDASGNYLTYDYTDVAGAYAITMGLPAGTYYALAFSYHGYYNELYDNISCASGCDVTTGTPISVGAGEEVTGIDFALDKAGAISGTVTDAATSLGIRSTYVYIYNESGNYAGYGYTDSNGFYKTSQGLPAGTYFARTDNSSGYFNELYQDITCNTWCDVTAGTPISVVAGADVTGIDFALDKGSTISGTVTDALTSSGIADVGVYFYDAEGNWAAEAYTDTDGDFTTRQGLSAGSYFVVTDSSWSGAYRDQLYDGLDCHDWSCDILSGTPVVVGEQETVSGIDFALYPASFIFADDFEDGSASAWSSVVGGM